MNISQGLVGDAVLDKFALPAAFAH